MFTSLVPLEAEKQMTRFVVLLYISLNRFIINIRNYSLNKKKSIIQYVYYVNQLSSRFTAGGNGEKYFLFFFFCL